MLMFGTYSVINIVVLLNLLIAMMNHSYQLISVRETLDCHHAPQDYDVPVIPVTAPPQTKNYLKIESKYEQKWISVRQRVCTLNSGPDFPPGVSLISSTKNFQNNSHYLKLWLKSRSLSSSIFPRGSTTSHAFQTFPVITNRDHRSRKHYAINFERSQEEIPKQHIYLLTVINKPRLSQIDVSCVAKIQFALYRPCRSISTVTGFAEAFLGFLGR